MMVLEIINICITYKQAYVCIYISLQYSYLSIYILIIYMGHSKDKRNMVAISI